MQPVAVFEECYRCSRYSIVPSQLQSPPLRTEERVDIKEVSSVRCFTTPPVAHLPQAMGLSKKKQGIISTQQRQLYPTPNCIQHRPVTPASPLVVSASRGGKGWHAGSFVYTAIGALSYGAR